MVPDTEPFNRKILIIDNDRDTLNTIRHYLSENPESIAVNSPAESYPNEYYIAAAEPAEDGSRLVVEAEMAGRPFAMIFIGEYQSPQSGNSDIIVNIRRDCPDLEIVVMGSSTDEQPPIISASTVPSDHLVTIRKPLVSFEIKLLARLLTDKWSYRHFLRQSYEKTYHEQMRRQCELERSILRLQQEIISQRRMYEIGEEKFLRYKNIFNRADCPLIVSSGKDNRPFGKILDVNQCFCQLSGYSLPEVKNMNFCDIFEEDVISSATGPNLFGSIKTRTTEGIPVELKSRRLGPEHGSLVISAVNVSVFQPVI